MNIREITDNIYYVGVNDRVTTRFEGLWPLPLGVSYNSYIVKGGEKTALIDTVRIDEVREYLEQIDEITGGKPVDYVVINHMEPDHSGSLPEIVRRFPNVKLVGNRQTISMVRDFYHIDGEERFLQVADGDTLDLGGRTLQFFLTPMVHWPETMVTYVADVKVLFSGDAFGTFGALDGGVIDSEMNTDRYFPEMYRYYSNIVGKYGRHVQAAYKKLAPLQIEYICSTHGPVWHDRLQEVFCLVDRLSKYEPEPGVTIIYGSMYGNTAEAAELIARELAAKGIKEIHIHNASTSTLSDMISDAYRYEGLIVGSATYSMSLFPEVEALMKALEIREIKNKVFAAFGSYTWAANVVVPSLESYAERMKLEVTATALINRSLSDETRSACVALADAVADKLRN